MMQKYNVLTSDTYIMNDISFGEGLSYARRQGVMTLDCIWGAGSDDIRRSEKFILISYKYKKIMFKIVSQML